MKLKYIIPSFVAVLGLMLTSCSDDEDQRYLSGAQVSSSYVTISPDGGSAKITITSKEEWTLDYDVDFETDSLSAEKGKVNYIKAVNQLALKNDNEDNTWISVSPVSGDAGKTEITFSAAATGDDRQSTLKIKIGDTYQTIVVSQKAAATELPVSTVKEVLDGSDGKTYRVKGSCSTIANTSYGNWYMTDEDGNSLYIYGTVDATGSYNWSSFGIEPGDVVTVEGPRSTYGSTVELVDASFIKVEKALLSTKETTKTIAKTDDEFTITLTQKGTDLSFYTNSSWLTFNPGYTVNKSGDYVFTIKPEANNTGVTRVDTLYFTSANAKNSTRLPILVTQLATDVEENVTVFALAQKLTASTNNRQPVTFDVELKNAKVTFKSGSNTFIEDETGGLCIYNNQLKLKAGDVVTGRVWGSGYTYNGLPQATAFNYELATVESGVDVQPTIVTVAELAANPDKYISRYLRLENATVGSTIDVTYAKVGSAGSVTDGTNTIPLNHQSTGTYKQKNLTADDSGTRMYYYFNAEQGSSVTFNFIPSYYKNNLQLNIYQQAWLE